MSPVPVHSGLLLVDRGGLPGQVMGGLIIKILWIKLATLRLDIKEDLQLVHKDVICSEPTTDLISFLFIFFAP